jgi:hypothetical protein
MGQEPHLNTAAQKALDAAQERGGLVIMGNEGVANEFSSRACDFFDRFRTSTGCFQHKVVVAERSAAQIYRITNGL